MADLFKEKAYKLLYEKYSSLYNNILHRGRNVVQYSLEDEEKLKYFVTTVVDREKYDYCGIQNKTDTAIVKVVEYLLNDNDPVK